MNGASKRNRNETNNKYCVKMKARNKIDNNITQAVLHLPISDTQTYLDSNDNLTIFLCQLKIKAIQYCVSSFPGRDIKFNSKCNNTYIYVLRFQVLNAVNINTTIFWDVIQCGLVDKFL